MCEDLPYDKTAKHISEEREDFIMTEKIREFAIFFVKFGAKTTINLDFSALLCYTINVAGACVQALDTSMVWRQTSSREETRNRYGFAH